MAQSPSADSSHTHPSQKTAEKDLENTRRLRMPTLEDWQQMKRLWHYTKPYRRYFYIGLVAATIASLLGLVFPALARELFNGAFESEQNTLRVGGGLLNLLPNDAHVGTSQEALARLNRLTLLLVGIFAVQAVFNYLRTYYIALVGEGVVADLRRSVYNHLLELPLNFFESRKIGEISSRLTSDASTIQNAVSQAMVQLFNQCITLLGGTVFLFVLNARLTLVMLSVLPIVIIAGAFFGRMLRKISTEFQDAVADANADAEEALVGIRVVKSFTAENFEQERYGKRIQHSYNVAMRRARWRAIFVPSMIMAMFTGITVVLWYGGRQVVQGQLLAGDLIAFLMLTFFVAGSIGSFVGLYSQFQQALGASKRIFELLDTQSSILEPSQPQSLATVSGNIIFEDVDFGYGDRDEIDVLRDVTINAKAGEVLALVGRSGAGKTTLVSLIPRFYDVTEGRILLDGIDIRQLSLEHLRNSIGIVPQETQLFSGSIADNIGYGRSDANQAEIESAAKAANAHDFICNFPASYQTLVGERGVKLSGGQRQRIAIARALLKDPKLLILDEATSSLDSESEALVQHALETLMQGRTVFVIAHRLSTIRNADSIIVLDAGRVVQQGNHDTLLAQGGLYQELYDKQFTQIKHNMAS